MYIIKRSGEQVDFDKSRVTKAVSKAWKEVEGDIDVTAAECVANYIEKKCNKADYVLGVEQIQDLVVKKLEGINPSVATAYIKFRAKKEKDREDSSLDKKILSISDCSNEEVMQENSNKNPVIVSTQRDYIAGSVSRDITERKLLPKDVVKAHKDGAIHFHDSDYFVTREHNCDLVNLKDMLENGTVISGTYIDTPKTFGTACTIATQIIAQVASCQYGGQSISLAHLAPFVQRSREKYYEMMKGVAYGKYLDDVVDKLVYEDVKRGVQTIQYQVQTLMTTNGQAPFITVFMYIDEVPEGQLRDDLVLIIKEVLKQRILGVKNEKGIYITPAFPKLIYVLDDDNIKPDTKYWEVTMLAAQCSAKRMVPDYISAKVMRELKGDVYTCMGCRSFLTPREDHKYYGRFNQGVVTINLPYVALESEGSETKFWELMEKYTELCYEALMCRHERLHGTLSDVAPILWQYGALARLNKGETIDKLLHNGYSTISLGYAGVYEMTLAMKGCSHTSKGGKEFALKVMQFLNDKCAEWKERHPIDFSLYGTPLESTTYKFAKAIKKFPTMKDVNDHNYITNSYHVCVREQIDAFTKLSFESEFQNLSPGGAISYIEVPDLKGNMDALLTILQYMYENIMYSEINTKSDYCQVCGYDGEIPIIEEEKKLIFRCPQCGNHDRSKLNIARRTCGYIGTNEWNQGRTQEIAERVLHL